MPSWFDFVTVEARTVLLAAGVTARQDGRTEVRADDFALALLGQRDGAVSEIWRRLGVDRDRLADRLRSVRSVRSAGPAVRFDPTSRRLWEQAYLTALDSRAGRLGTRQLLLALLEAGPATVVAAFAELGVNGVAVRALPDRVREVEQLPARPGFVSRWWWRWARSQGVIRRRRALTLALVAPSVLLVLVILGSFIV
jgi:ATP-dependent Clp protease ATP-binding subunit ClpA